MRLPLSILFSLCLNLSFSQQRFSPAQLRRLDSISTQDVPKNAPGIATAIIRDGKLMYEKYAGFADFKDSTLIGKSTRFNIASNGKQFTALAVLTLIDSKKLKLTDDIRLYYPSLSPLIKDRITIQSLLNHTSGIRDCYDLWSLMGYTWWKQSFSNKDVLALLEKQSDLNFPPDSRFLYSNTNYILLAMIIEKVTGMSFVDYTNKMFEQLNMPNTSFVDNTLNIRGPIARSYFNFNTWTTYDWIWKVCGDGNIFSTLEDQIQWEKIIQGKSKTRIKKEIIERSQQPIENSTFKTYGYGLEFGKYKGLDYRFHEGATGAWKATVTRFPGQKTSLLTVTNTGKSIPSMQTRQMADIVFNLKADAAYLITKPAKIGKALTDEDILGTYLTDTDFAFQFEKREGKIFLKRSGRNDVELEREAANIFHQKYDTLFKQEFTTNDKGELQVTAYYINHSPYSLVKQSADFSTFQFESLVGKYSNAETGTVMEIISHSEKNYKVKIGSRDTTNGLLITPNKLMVNNYSIQFESPIHTKVGELFLNGDRIKQVKFVRVN